MSTIYVSIVKYVWKFYVIRVFHKYHNVTNNGNAGIKGFHNSKIKLPPGGFNLMITG